MDNFITRFCDSLKSPDLKGAKQILTTIPDQPDRICLEVLNRVALLADDRAWELLLFLTQIHFGTPGIRKGLLELIVDKARVSFRFLPILYRTGTEKKIQESAPLMKQVLSNEIDTGILMETIQAVGKYKITSLVDEISEYIYFDNDELKAHAVRALGQIGSIKALRLLEQAAATVKCDQSILDTISVLKQAPDSTQRIDPPKNNAFNETALYRALESTDLGTRFNAFTELSTVKNTTVERLKQNIGSTHHDLVINTIEIIGATMPEAMTAPLFSLIADQKIPSTIRFAAYEALGAFPEVEFSPTTLNDIDNPDLHVRMAAINVLDKTPTDGVLAGIKERIETGRRNGEMICEAILDIKAGNIIESLMDSDTFAYIASNYLLRQAAPSPLKGYIKTLMDRGLKATAKKFTLTLEKKQTENRPLSLVLGRSKTMLAFYEKRLYQKGYAPLPFLLWQNALKSTETTMPKLIVSDLFLNGITGAQFALQIQHRYPTKELDVVISTLQQTFMGNRLRSVCAGIGVHEILAFPAGGNQIPSP